MTGSLLAFLDEHPEFVLGFVVGAGVVNVVFCVLVLLMGAPS